MQAKAEVKANLKAHSQKLSPMNAVGWGGMGDAERETQTPTAMTFVSVGQ